MVWQGPKTDLISAIEAMNQVNNRIKFTYDINHSKINFLDVIYIQDQQLETTLHRKETGFNNLLHFSSFHQNALKAHLPYSQLLRVKRIVWDPEHPPVNITNMIDRFHDRGYPTKVLTSATNRALAIPCMQLLTPHNKKTKSDRMVMVS